MAVARPTSNIRAGHSTLYTALHSIESVLNVFERTASLSLKSNTQAIHKAVFSGIKLLDIIYPHSICFFFLLKNKPADQPVHFIPQQTNLTFEPFQAYCPN